jgi:hypothetical protein
MKKLVVISIVTTMLLGLGTVFGQASATAEHDVSVTIPSLLMIRLTLDSNVEAVANPDAVVFSWDAAGFEPVGTFEPTNLDTANWDTVRVFANGDGWSLSVATAATAGFDWSNVRVTPQEVSGVTLAAFDLPDGASIALISGQDRTNGWRDLGFGPAQFALTLDGSEEPDTYTTTVTYTVSNP